MSTSGPGGKWRHWNHFVFMIMHRTARPAAEFFGLPANQGMEVGAQIELSAPAETRLSSN